MGREFIPVMGMVLAIVAIVSGTVQSVVKMVLNNKSQDWGKNGNAPVPPLFEKMFEKSIAERDDKIRRLEDRVSVLEKIVTDEHGAGKLADEIERLRS